MQYAVISFKYYIDGHSVKISILYNYNSNFHITELVLQCKTYSPVYFRHDNVLSLTS